MFGSINSATDPTAAAQSAASSGLTGAAGGQGMGREAFLKLLIAQVRHQDPLKPMDDTAFIAELAQFSALEQAISTNDRLELLALQQRGFGNTQVASLVGKSVTVRGSSVTLDGQGFGAPVAFTLGEDAKDVTVTIKDKNGNAVRTMHLGPKAAGVVKLTWDGRDDMGTSQPAGNYTVSVTAKNAADGAVEVVQESTGVLKSVSFEKGYPELKLDSGVTAPASDLLRVNG
jgi:flagellar basal-body rod modification protein FlgD